MLIEALSCGLPFAACEAVGSDGVIGLLLRLFRDALIASKYHFRYWL
jgi:hypothetical protein